MSGIKEALENCIHCDQPTDSFSDNGEPVCDDCSLEHCAYCLIGECEIEVRNDYVCADCYGSMVDSAYDSIPEDQT